MSNTRLNKDPNRVYRVALLRADEAARLTRDANNQYADLCPHLSVFHNEGQTIEGGFWRSCTICIATDETPPDRLAVAARDAEATLARSDRRDIAFGWCALGLVIGALLGWGVL